MVTDVLEGAHIAGCRIESVAGRGGMGIVYRATQLSLGRPVALKLIAPEHAADSDFRDRFQRESRMAAAIDHPNVIPVYEAGEEDGRLYLVMRWVDGHRPAPAARARRAGSAAARGGDRPPGRGRARRRPRRPGSCTATSSPPTSCSSGEHAYLADFGLTRLAEREDQRDDDRRTSSAPSTTWRPSSSTPGPSDARADVYALGCVLYAALTGRPPFIRETVPATMLAHLHEPPPRPPTRRRPAELDRVIARALAKDPADRYPSAGDFGRAVLAAAEGRSVTEEERSVARGAAAPTIRREEQLWSGPIDPDERRGGGARRRSRPTARASGRAGCSWAWRSRSRRARSASPAVPDGGDNVPPPGSPVSESEVERLARTFANAYENERPADIRRIITSDAERVLPNERQAGRDDVVAAYERQFARSRIEQFDLSQIEVSAGRWAASPRATPAAPSPAGSPSASSATAPAPGSSRSSPSRIHEQDLRSNLAAMGDSVAAMATTDTDTRSAARR